MQGDARHARQHREDMRQEISRNRAGKRGGSGVLGIFARELSLDARRLGAFLIPVRRKKGVS